MNKLCIPFITVILVCGASQSIAQVTIVNGASFDPAQPVAPGSFATAFGQGLCPQTMAGDWIAPGQLPTILGGCSVTVNGAPAMMQYVSPGQVNFIMPAGVASGPAQVTVSSGSQMMSGNVVAGAAGPGMFALNGMGMGEAAMLNAAMWKAGPFSTTTNGQPTYIAIYVTGMDLAATPAVLIGGVPVDVMWFGNAPGYVGLQQINITLPPGMAGVGRAPVMVTSNGQMSNVTFMHVLPTSTMMQGMPGWSQGMMIGENMARGHELSYMAYNPANNTALVADENDDVVRVISLASNNTKATITLPNGSEAHAIAVNGAGNLAAVALSAKASVAIIDLVLNKVSSVIATGYYPNRLAFSGSNLLVTNSASGTVAVIDAANGIITQTVKVALGASGIAVAGNTAVVANMQSDSVSIINLSNSTVSTIALPAGTRPYEVTMAGQGSKAVITAPMSNTFIVLDVGTKTVTEVPTKTWNGMGPGAIAANGNTIYIANQMTASVTVADTSGTVIKTFAVDPGPAAVAVAPARNQLLVLSEGTGTLDIVDLASYAVIQRIDAGDTERQGQFAMPLISSITPSSAAAGSTFTLTVAGSGFQALQGIDFVLAGSGMGMGGGMMGGSSNSGMGQADPNIKVSGLQANAAGTQITASVQILSGAVTGTRQIRLQTTYGSVMGMMTNTLFTVTR